MKFSRITFFLVLCLFFLVSCHHFLKKDEVSVKRKMAFEMFREIIDDIRVADDLYLCGIMEAAPKGKYRSFGLRFFCRRILTKDEGRRLIFKCLAKMQEKFNSNFEFSQYIENGKFAPENLDVGIIVQLTDGPEVHYPNIGSFSFAGGILYYRVTAPNVRGYYSEEEETYEEALHLVNEGVVPVVDL